MRSTPETLVFNDSISWHRRCYIGELTQLGGSLSKFPSTTLLASGILALGVGMAHATPIFPRVGASTLGPAIIFTFNANGTISTTSVSTQTYDGSDDVEVGIVNNSATVKTSINLSGSGNGGGIFAFDGDGIVDYIDANTGHYTVGNPSDPTGYGGIGVTFSNISLDQTSGTVNFSAAANGGTAYFGLESSPSSINGGGGIVVGNVPEPASLTLLAGAVAGVGALRRRRPACA